MKKNKIIIAGGTGFLGNELAQHFSKLNYEVVILSRKISLDQNGIRYVLWDGKSLGDWINEVENTDLLINLSGKSVDCRYTEKNKALILSSRIESTMILHNAINQLNHPPKLWINASTATIYEGSLTKIMTEKDGEIGNDFSMTVAKEWEKAFFSEDRSAVRQIAMRISLVIGNSGGVLPVLKRLTKLGLGGFHGNGNQKFSWIHIQDLIGIVDYFLENEQFSGVYNCTAPSVTTNKIFMRNLRKQMKVPLGIPTPAPILKIGAKLIGTETELILKSRNVAPEKLVNEGFQFKFPTIEEALAELN